MPTLLVHMLLAAAIQASINVFMNLPGISEFNFYAAITAILVDLDHPSDGERSPYVHSLTTMLGVLVTGVAAIILLRDAWMSLLVCSIVVGSVSHILLDIVDREGIFAVPWNCDRRIFLKRFSRRCSPGRGRLHLVIAVISGTMLFIFLLL